MQRPARLLRHLLAALLLLQVVVAPTLCLARAGHAAQEFVEICTAEGMTRVVLAPDGSGEAPAPNAHDGAFCPFCHALPQGAAVEAPVPPPPAWVLTNRAWAEPGLAAPPPAIRGPPSGARAPPSLLS